MTDSLPLVSVVIPCRNERRYIAAVVESIAANDYPKDQLEVIVVDGASDDGTLDVLADCTERHEWLSVLHNPRRITPAALNIGIRQARGDVIVRMDAHCRYPSDYISKLVAWLGSSKADNVGGLWRTMPGGDSTQARAIAHALSHPFAVGNAHYRLGIAEPKWVDTVPFGCYDRQVFERIGLFDEELVRNQDDEFNHRLLNAGGRILLVPDVSCEYFARESLAKLARMFYQYGLFKPLVVRKLGRIVTGRQLAPPIFALAVIASPALLLASTWTAAATLILGLVYLGGVLSAALPTLRTRGGAFATWLVVIFPLIHLSYGLGFLRGVGRFLLARRSHPLAPTSVEITR